MPCSDRAAASSSTSPDQDPCVDAGMQRLHAAVEQFRAGHILDLRDRDARLRERRAVPPLDTISNPSSRAPCELHDSGLVVDRDQRAHSSAPPSEAVGAPPRAPVRAASRPCRRAAPEPARSRSHRRCRRRRPRSEPSPPRPQRPQPARPRADALPETPGAAPGARSRHARESARGTTAGAAACAGARPARRRAPAASPPSRRRARRGRRTPRPETQSPDASRLGAPDRSRAGDVRRHRDDGKACIEERLQIRSLA